MKRLLALLMAAVMLLSLAACSTNRKDRSFRDDDEDEDPRQDLPYYEFDQFGEARITVVGAEFAEDDYGDSFLRVYYDYDNTSDTAVGATPYYAMHYGQITQDGEELEVFELSEDDECAIPEDLLGECSILPGCTSRNTILIYCDPDGGDITIPCYIMTGSWMYNPDDIEYFNIEIDPEDLMGAPEAWEMPTITDPEYAAGLPTSGKAEDHEASINGWELTVDDDGNTVLRVKLTITNNGDQGWPPVMIQPVEAYQDGLSLIWSDAWYLEECTEEDEAFDEELAPGETVDCNALFVLRNDSPVEVVAEQSGDDLRLGIICDVKAELEAQAAQEEAQQQASAEALKALVGTWDRTDGWDDQLIFNADGTGIHDMTGDKYPFRCTLEGDLLTLNYDDGDVSEFYVKLEGDQLTLTDDWDDSQIFARQK
ncbi:MAG: DUF5067 domain-containing protein [Oscillospiraceae bacterium]|nr:DUF5067 domain-containing protein [Oscillospiraceae bacterium]